MDKQRVNIIMFIAFVAFISLAAFLVLATMYGSILEPLDCLTTAQHFEACK